MTASDSLKQLLKDDLKKQIENGKAIIIVGAGISMYTTNKNVLAGWQGLLHHGVDRCKEINPSLPTGWANRQHDAINDENMNELLGAAEQISMELGAPNGGEFSRWLRETAGSLKAEQSDVIEAINALGILIATTNYDGLLEQVTGLPPITWKDNAKVERVLRGDDKGIIHLHGYWEKPESVILGIRSYEKVLGNDFSQTVLRAIQLMQTTIFAGFGEGLQDPNFGALLEWTGKTLGQSEYRRFRLARDQEVEKLQKQHPPDQRLFVISYGEDFSKLASYLRSLAPSRSLAAPPETMPGQTTPKTIQLPVAPYCFGRSDELADLLKTLLADEPEPTPILGPPGIGKSTLILTALRDQAVKSRYGNRRYFIRCDGATTRGTLAAHIAMALGLELTSNIEPVCLYTLAEAPSVLVLDNFETVWDEDRLEAEAFLGLLSETPGLRLIITMRGSERPGGVHWREESISVEPLELAASREAFLAIAGNKFQNDPLLDDLCKDMEGVPLAIHLIAHVAEGDPNLSGIWKRWRDERTKMLRINAGLDRSTNIEISYKLSLDSKRMNLNAMRLLSILAFLPDGLAHCDLESVFPNKPHEAASTIRKAALAFDEANRLRLLAPLREYVKKYHPPKDKNLEKLISHYLNLVAEYAVRIGKEGGAEAVMRLAPETANIEFLACLCFEKYATPARIRICIKWGDFVRFTGMGSTRPLEAAIEAAKSLKESKLLGPVVESIGDIEFSRSNLEQAFLHFESALNLHKKAGTLMGQANCLYGLSCIALQRSDHETAHARIKEALPLYIEHGGQTGQANCIFNLSQLAFEHLDYETALDRVDEALTLYKKIGDITGEANCMHNLGCIALERSDYETARDRIEEALFLYQKGGNIIGEASCIYDLGCIAFVHSDYETARVRIDEALPLFKKIGEIIGEANCIAGIGEIALKSSDCETARAHLMQALTLCKKSGRIHNESLYIRILGDIAVKCTNLEEAHSFYDEALRINKQIENILGEAQCVRGFGDIEAAKSNAKEAQAHYEEALKLFEKIPNPINIGKTHRSMARIATDENERNRHVTNAHEIFERIKLPHLVEELKMEFPGDF